MKYGYAHGSTDDQNHAMQLAALKNAGCMIVFTHDGISGCDDEASCFGALPQDP